MLRCALQQLNGQRAFVLAALNHNTPAASSLANLEVRTANLHGPDILV